MDDSFTQPGAIPFKWEIRPGVPKLPHSHEPITTDHHRPLAKQEEMPMNQSRSFPETPRKLRPPPAAGFNFHSPFAEPRTRSFRSAPRARSERHRFDVQNLMTRPSMGVAADGCFPSPPLLRRVTEKKKKKKKQKSGSEPDYMSDLETVSRWSVSSRKSVSPFHDSLSFSSQEPSPRRPVNDADWPGFALF
ncbi:uncharacterized protein LOC107760685 [Nicotiana tabacum]|uniref:Uncharacterized protein LOC107760685 n=1 Tax=Nicotiana tabacum TaxID=4097 RepID=A0A1S3X361_TOBAC|nr:PREDICTED: uncharacterized protein LOC107760685 [Nicotiana tabacum]